MEPHETGFYYQPTLELAKALLGCIVIKETPLGTASGIIVETEAYFFELIEKKDYEVFVIIRL